MSSDEPDSYPIVIVEDRYQGVYSSGRWFALADANKPLEGMIRAAWVLENGPGADDGTCSIFWASQPPWIAAGATPEEAVDKLRKQPGADSDAWTPPKWEDDPSSARWRRFLKLSAE